MLSSGRKTRGYARYSPLLYFPLFVLPDRPLQSTLELRSRSTSLMVTTMSRPPLTRTRSSSVDPRQEALPFRSISLMLFVLAFLRQNLTNYVSTQILCLYDLCIRVCVTPPLHCNIFGLSFCV